MAHESLESYFLNNFSALYHKDIGHTNKFTLSDFEEMIPFEREIYMSLMAQKIEELSKKNNN